MGHCWGQDVEDPAEGVRDLFKNFNNNNNNIRFLERISKLYALTIKSNVMNKIMTSKAKNSF